MQQQEELVDLALDTKMDPDYLLEMAINSKTRYGYSIIANQQYYIEKALDRGAQFTNILILANAELPDKTTAEWMLKKGLTPDQLLKLVICTDCEQISDEGKLIKDPKKIQLQLEIVEMALEKGASVNKLDHLGYTLPSLELIKLLLKYGLTADRLIVFISYILPLTTSSDDSTIEIDQRTILERDELIKWLES